jgi:hypothetical protein
VRRIFVLVALCALACQHTARVASGLEQGLNPFSSTSMSVLATTVHGPYLVADLTGTGGPLRMLAPADDPSCAQLLAPESRVTYRKHGVFGRFERGDASCDAVGVASLAAWRDRQPRAPGRPVPRATVHFEVIARDSAVVLLRGRFPLAGRVGIPAGYDLVAMLPNDPACQKPIEQGVATMEFRDAGDPPYRIVAGGANCPVLGFATPLPPGSPPA